MSSTKKTLGQAIDEVIAALEPLEEAARPTAVRAACEHLGLQEPASQAPITPTSTQPQPSGTPTPTQTATPPAASQDIRSLKEVKQPSTALEMACIVAYYLDSLAPPNERASDITKGDLEKYFKQASYRLPKRIEQVLIDAKAAGYLDSVSRGRYKLNPVGHNLVVHNLPRKKSE